MSLSAKIKPLVEKLTSHAGFQRYLKNTSWLFGGQMLRMGLGLVVSVAIARYLGPENFGLYSFVLSIVGIVAILSKLGLENLLKRELVANENMRNELMGTSIVLSTTAGAVIYALMIFTVGHLSDNSLLIGIFALIGAQLSQPL